jgi:hypothetical protein
MEQPEDFDAIGSTSGGFPPEDLKLAEKEKDALEDGAHLVRKEVHSIAVTALRFGAWLLASIILIRVWHLAGPSEIAGAHLRWLTETELQSIDKMLFSSAFGGLVLGYLKEIMAPTKK